MLIIGITLGLFFIIQTTPKTNSSKVEIKNHTSENFILSVISINAKSKCGNMKIKIV